MLLRKKHNIHLISILGIGCILAILNCGGSDKPTEPEGDEPIISSNVEVLGTSSKVVLTGIDSTSLQFMLTDTTLDVQIGDILVGTDSGGYLRKVISLSATDSTLTVGTDSASLTDAIVKGKLSDTLLFNISRASLQNRSGDEEAKVYLAEGAKLSEAKIILDGVVLYSGDKGNITITNGSIDFQPEIDIGFDIDNHIVKEFHSIARGQLGVSLDVEATTSAIDLSDEVLVASISKQYVVFIKFVPVVVNVTLNFNAGYSATAGTISLHTGYETSHQVEFGAKYNGSIWSPHWSRTTIDSSHQTVWDEPNNLDLRLYIEPEVRLEFYWAAGPYLALDPFINFVGEFNSPQWNWQLSGGVESTIGFQIHILDWDIADFNHTFPVWNHLIANGNGTIDEEQCTPFTINSNQMWQTTGIFLNAGESVTITATGAITTSYCNGCPIEHPWRDPNGCDTSFLPDCLNRVASATPLCPVESNYIGNLVGRIGESGNCFLVGSVFAEVVSNSGFLYLAFNDGTDAYDDNSGTYQALICVRQ